MPANAKVVICIHGFCQSKALWLLPRPLQAARQITIDRFGYGDSSGDGAGDVKDNWLLMDKQSEEYLKFVDLLGIDKGYILGHSGGTYVAQALGMRLDQQQRLLGVALMGAMPHPRHSKLRYDQTWLELPHQDGTIAESVETAELGTTCCCISTKWMIDTFVASAMTFGDRVNTDPGFAEIYTKSIRADDGGLPVGANQYPNGPRFLHGRCCVGGLSVWTELQRNHGLRHVSVSWVHLRRAG